VFKHVAISSFVVALVGLCLTAVPLLVQAIRFISGTTKYDSLQTTLEKEKLHLINFASKRDDGWDRIITLLDSGDLIMPHVAARLRRRIGFLIVVALGTATFVGKEFRSGQWSNWRDIASIGLVLANWLLPFLSSARTALLDPEEEYFLRNYGILHDIFYEKLVVPLIKEFNARCRDSKLVRDEIAKYEAKVEEMIKNVVSEFQTRQTEFKVVRKKALPAATNAGLLEGEKISNTPQGPGDSSKPPDK
jgi:hypothetical protein